MNLLDLFDRWRDRDGPLDGDEEPNDPQLRELLARARSLPREAEPRRDLWMGIENRIVRAQSAPAQRSGLLGLFPRPALAAAAGLALVVATSMATLWVSDRGPVLPVGDPETRALADRARSLDGVSGVHERLLALLESRSSELPPEAVLALGENLQLIDAAIADIHRALLLHPDDEALEVLLADAHRRESELLESLEWWLQPGRGGRS